MFVLTPTLPRAFAAVHVDLSTMTVKPDVAPAPIPRQLAAAAVSTLETTPGEPVDAFARSRAELVTPATLAALVALGAARGFDAEAVFVDLFNVHAAAATNAAVL